MRLICQCILSIGVSLLLAVPAIAQPVLSREAIAIPAQPGAIALPFEAKGPDKEVWHLDAGKIAVRNVTRPALVAFRPVGRASRAAVIIAPGGGFLGLAIEKEGWDVARWFANHGVTAFVLKYRVPPTPPSQPQFADELERMIRGEVVEGGFTLPDDTPPEAFADGVPALRYVRAHAAEYGLDPAKVGFMGFSAGGYLTRTLVAQGGTDRPAFAALSIPA